ncbi:MAG: sulfite exporter TauE/SafE family protein [Chloroflexi bacterium]|nr:sulfite exporter TauE/SafE family protein [Chloroflexota bacterium]
MTSQWEILALGLLLGFRHALDPDHVVAVSTIVSQYRNPLRSIWIGVSWGLGHTTTLFIAGTILLLLNLRIPERLSLAFEFVVGIMLVLLGVQAFLSFRQKTIHIHLHSHDDGWLQPHGHVHSHGATGEPEHEHDHAGEPHSPSEVILSPLTTGDLRDKPFDSAPSATFRTDQDRGAGKALKPFFRLKSYVVGTVHGLAGSATLMLLVLANIGSFWNGAAFILVFGLGTVISMGTISIFISLPFTVSSRLPRLNRAIQGVTGVFSIAFGLFLMYETGIGGGLFGGS